ncbi:MAG TPA: hypothetical protein PKD23_09440 [Bellilinea sp.]|jgi:hypothetical protein|nr:hypothetical protein [Bellilinea sp.]
MNQKIIQAYRQAPWRVQLQWIGVFLLVLVVAIGASGIYLYVSAQATAAGANIHSLEIQREELNIRIADLRTQLAYANSAVVMEVRAEKLGFRHAQQEDLIYLAVPGYTGRAPVFLAPPPTTTSDSQSLIKQAYKQSLWEWFYQGAFRLMDVSELQP